MIKILIVEDEAPISNLMKMSLRKAGYFCDCAYDGEEAAEKIGQKMYDPAGCDAAEDRWI